MVKRGITVVVSGAAIVVAGLSGCSSGDESETSGATTAIAESDGVATVKVDGQDQEVAGTVVCSDMAGNTNIAIGDASSGIGVVVSTGDEPEVQSVALGNVNGITLGYQAGGEGDAKADKDGKKYKVSGTATGVDMANPLQPVNMPFEIEVSCP